MFSIKNPQRSAEVYCEYYKNKKSLGLDRKLINIYIYLF